MKEKIFPPNRLPYEKKKFSQHGEDGIIEEMLSYVVAPLNHTFLEIGWGANGINNTKNLLVNHNWSGVGIDSKPPKIDISQFPNLKHFCQTVTPQNCNQLLNVIPNKIDFFSLDIDSFDYDILKNLLESKFFPKIICVETNKFFGQDSIASFPFIEHALYHKRWFCSGSISKYKLLLEKFGYKYLTVDTSEVNAFFYLEEYFKTSISNLYTIDNGNRKFTDDKVYSWLIEKTSPKNNVAEATYWSDKIQNIYNKKT